MSTIESISIEAGNLLKLSKELDTVLSNIKVIGAELAELTQRKVVLQNAIDEQIKVLKEETNVYKF